MLGGIHGTAPNVHIDSEAPNIGHQFNWDARIGRGSLDDHFFLPHIIATVDPFASQETGSSGVGIHFNLGTDQASINNEPTLSANSHPIQTQPNASLVNAHVVFVEKPSPWPEPHRGNSWTLVGQRPVSVVDYQLGKEFSAPSSDRAISNFEILNFQEVPLFPLELLPSLIGEFGDVKPILEFANFLKNYPPNTTGKPCIGGKLVFSLSRPAWKLDTGRKGR